MNQVLLSITLDDPAIVFQWLFDPSQSVDPNEVHGKALLILVDPGAQDALRSDRHVDTGGVLAGDAHRLEHRVAQFAVGPAVGQPDDGITIEIITDGPVGAGVRELSYRRVRANYNSSWPLGCRFWAKI